MLYLIAVLTACTVGLITLLVAQAIPARPPEVAQRLAELQQMSAGSFDALERRRRQSRREQWQGLLTQLGARLEHRRNDSRKLQRMLVQAGFRHPQAVSLYWGSRVAFALACATAAMLLVPLAGAQAIPFAFWLAIGGWILPAFYVGRRLRRRKSQIQKALPDTLDALVVCVEAGLGLNLAIRRVAEEIRHVSPLMSEELALLNLEIRAGQSRAEAMRNLAERTGVDDMASLVTMLIQTDRFGTSVAQALRVHSDSLRIKRRQRAEEAAAKTAIKMIFPLVLFIFPAMLVVILGPAGLSLVKTLGGFGQ
jgi:tight adherence protein C